GHWSRHTSGATNPAHGSAIRLISRGCSDGRRRPESRARPRHARIPLPGRCRSISSWWKEVALNVLIDGVDLQQERVFAALKRLQLTHLRDTLSGVLSEAAKGQWTYLEFLDQILRREVDTKQGKRIRMGLQIAHFPCVRTIEGFDFSLQP